MYCPTCRTEYRPEIERCADCGAPLVHELPAPEAEEPRDWVELKVVTAETEAFLIQGFLETEGLPCSLESLVFHAEPFNFGPLSKVRIHVLRSDLERAKALLAQLEGQTGPPSEPPPDV